MTGSTVTASVPVSIPNLGSPEKICRNLEKILHSQKDQASVCCVKFVFQRAFTLVCISSKLLSRKKRLAAGIHLAIAQSINGMNGLGKGGDTCSIQYNNIYSIFNYQILLIQACFDLYLLLCQRTNEKQNSLVVDVCLGLNGTH